MKILCFIIYTLSVLTTSCTHIHQYSTLDEINIRTKDKNAKITLINEQDLIGRNIYIAPDSTFWIEPNTGNKQSIITSEVSSIITKNRGRGALHGLVIGFLGGVVIGVLGGFLDGDDTFEEGGWFTFTAEQKALIGGIFLGGVGGLLGLPLGVARGSKDKFIIDYKEDIIKEKEMEKEMEMEKEREIKIIRTKVKKEEFLFNVELSAPLIPNSTIKLDVPPNDVLLTRDLLSQELLSKEFVVVSEGESDYILRFLYSVDKNKRLIGFTAYIVNSSTGKIEGVANFQNDSYSEISITEIIKEFINQLCPNMQ